MRWATAVMLVLLVLTGPAKGMEVPGLDAVYDVAESYGVSGDAAASAVTVFQGVLDQLDGLIRATFGTVVRLLAVVLLCALAQGLCPEWGKERLQVVELAGVLGVTALTINDMDVMIGLGRETIGRMRDFSQLLLPVVATLTAATGQIGAATARQGITVLFSEVLLSAINGLLVPLVYAYVAVCCAYAAVGNEGLKRLAGMIRGAVTVALTGFVLVFVGYLSASGAIAGSADAAAVKTAKLAISRTVPVVGGVLSDAAETVLVGAGVLKGSVGAVGALVVLAICLVPFLQLGLHYLAYKGVAVVTGIAADMRLCKLIDEVGSAFGLVLGMTGSCALILLVSLVSAITAVSV